MIGKEHRKNWALLVCLLVASCAGPKVRNSSALPGTYAHALKLYRSGHYKKALGKFQNYVRYEPPTMLTLSADFFAGRCQEKLGNLAAALSSYQTVINTATDQTRSSRRLKALALFRSSFVYERQNHGAEALAALLDSKRRIADMPEAIAKFELPAQLAMAYSRANHPNLANLYFKRAQNGLREFEADVGDVARGWLATTLFDMGQSTLASLPSDELVDNYNVFERAQGYLLRAALINTGESSQKAGKVVLELYQSLYSQIIKPLPGNVSHDDVRAYKSKQEKIQMAERALDLLDRAAGYLMPEAYGGKPSDASELWSKLASYKGKFNSLLYRGSVDTVSTPEALSLQSIFRPGVVIDPKGRLEHR